MAFVLACIYPDSRLQAPKASGTALAQHGGVKEKRSGQVIRRIVGIGKSMRWARGETPEDDAACAVTCDGRSEECQRIWKFEARGRADKSRREGAIAGETGPADVVVLRQAPPSLRKDHNVP